MLKYGRPHLNVCLCCCSCCERRVFLGNSVLRQSNTQLQLWQLLECPRNLLPIEVPLHAFTAACASTRSIVRLQRLVKGSLQAPVSTGNCRAAAATASCACQRCILGLVLLLLLPAVCLQDLCRTFCSCVCSPTSGLRAASLASAQQTQRSRPDKMFKLPMSTSISEPAAAAQAIGLQLKFRHQQASRHAPLTYASACAAVNGSTVASYKALHRTWWG
jgi:hypothetical protein